MHTLPSALFYDGVAYKSLDATNFSDDEKDFAQSRLRILSGLYGILRPFDGILPYRLEAQTPLSVQGFKNIYGFWNSLLAINIESDLKKQKNKILINLASDEYSKMITPHLSTNTRLVRMDFFEYKGDKLSKNIVEMKKARGEAAKFIIKNKIEDFESLIAVEANGYHYNNNLSQGNKLVFVKH